MFLQFHFPGLRKLYYAGSLLSIVLLASCNSHPLKKLIPGDSFDDDIEARTSWETMMLADPATGKIPDRIRAKELSFATTLPVQQPPQMKNGSFWQSRGPWNVGGRTRALAIDATNENVILAGSVSGGIYRSTDGGSSWNKITGPSQDLSITCIVQNHRPGKTNIWYAGTGEFIGASASGPNGVAFYLGDGILKSTDGGLTWHKLSSTSSGTPQKLDKGFDLVMNLAINEADTGDVVYAATSYNTGGIFRSSDGGATWKFISGPGILPNALYTDVQVSKTGVVYITRSSESTAAGIWRSTDGISFTNITPTGFPPTYQRIVIGIDPNDETNVYIFGYTPGYGKKQIDTFNNRKDYSSLWKYKYISGSGSGTGGSWTNLTDNLPDFGGTCGVTNTQTGYDLYVRVKPGDSKTVFLGTTNVWRSADAFSSTNNTSWIGGYGINTYRPSIKLYPNHHPDQHNLVFYPSNPNKMLSSCDGGIFRTDDNTASNVTYTSLNNGYLTSQFYSIAVDHATPGNDEILGGLQDNGTYLTRSSNPTDPWTMPGGGDGSFCAIADGRNDYYVATQLGKTYHVKIGSNGLTYQFARVDPLAAKGQLFICPYTMDPNNQTRMYYIARDRIWMNDDVTQIPMHNSLDTNAVNTGWNVMAGTIDANRFITAVTVSRKPADRLYYGTGNGKVYRVDNASQPNPVVKNISATTFPGGGWVSNIAVSPTNADQMIVVFANYSVISLFYSSNGGSSWKNISANLEQNADGSGNGPSCRWAAILPMNNGGKTAYFVGTSVGLFSTDSLAGTKTVWTRQSPDEIGNDIVTMIDTRKADGLVAVATHGNGVFTAHVNYAYQVSGIYQARNGDLPYQSFKCYPNPVSSGGVLNIEFDQSENTRGKLLIVNEVGKTISEISGQFNGSGSQKIPVKLPLLKAGIYYIRIDNGIRMMAGSFVIK